MKTLSKLSLLFLSILFCFSFIQKTPTPNPIIIKACNYTKIYKAYVRDACHIKAADIKVSEITYNVAAETKGVYNLSITPHATSDKITVNLNNLLIFDGSSSLFKFRVFLNEGNNTLVLRNFKDLYELKFIKE